jgi:hypothetical protein
MNGEADIIIRVNGEVLFDGRCSGDRDGEIRVKDTSASPRIYKTQGSPRLSERNKSDITFIDY